VTFLEAVNRVLRTTGIIKGDDDNISTFTDVQHNATLNLAMIAIQNELNSLVADALIPYERDTKSIVTVIGQREYALDPSFVRFWGTPLLYNAVDNQQIYEFDEDQLRQEIFNYKTVQSTPIYWYFTGGTTKKIGFYPIPDTVETWSYEIEKSVAVTNSGDTLPFQTDQEAQVFCNLAARNFLILFEEQPDKTLTSDSIYQTQKSVLYSLIAGTNAPRYYGMAYQ
jgi:hypothetical protein